MRALLSDLRDLLLPPTCACCGAGLAAGVFCPACRPLAATPTPPPRALDAWHAAIAHEGSGAEWVRRFKYPARGLAGLDPRAEAVAHTLVAALVAAIPGPLPDRVVPIPLHARRLRERGFSPAGELARTVARRAGVRRSVRLIDRTRDTPSQAGLSRAERRRNVAGAFVARGRAPARIWLVDDVATTGFTLAAAAHALRAAGAREIVGVCLAHRPLLR